jgi:hypothetical protein
MYVQELGGDFLPHSSLVEAKVVSTAVQLVKASKLVACKV